MGVVSHCLLKPGEYKVEEVVDLNNFSLDGVNTVGSNNKFYHMESHVPITGSNKYQIYCEYGPTGRVQAREYRHFSSHSDMKKEFDKILKSKLKKGYMKIDIAQSVIGSDEAKQIVKPVTFTNTGDFVEKKSSLHPETVKLIKSLMGATNTFVVQTLKCPLGQLTNKQIDDGREILNRAKEAVEKKESEEVIVQLTNKFYSLIPHNLGFGARGKLTNLLLNSEMKIAQKNDDLDTLLDAKQIGAVLSSDSSVDDQYSALNSDIQYLEHNTDMFKWISRMVKETYVYNRSSMNIGVKRAWSLTRNGERDVFLERAKSITCKKRVIPKPIEELVKSRKDILDDALYNSANINPLFHGTRTQNVTGITRSGLLVRPAGAIITGAMFGHGIYFSSQSIKSMNYTSFNSSYYAKGNDLHGYLFITDVMMGDCFVPHGSDGHLNTKKISPNHCTYAIGGKSGVINDEVIVYETDQMHIRYLLEVG